MEATFTHVGLDYKANTQEAVPRNVQKLSLDNIIWALGGDVLDWSHTYPGPIYTNQYISLSPLNLFRVEFSFSIGLTNIKTISNMFVSSSVNIIGRRIQLEKQG